MAYDRQKVISIALTEVGYLEKASNDQLDDKTANAGNKNYTKYARDMQRGMSRQQAWQLLCLSGPLSAKTSLILQEPV